MENVMTMSFADLLKIKEEAERVLQEQKRVEREKENKALYHRIATAVYEAERKAKDLGLTMEVYFELREKRKQKGKLTYEMYQRWKKGERSSFGIVVDEEHRARLSRLKNKEKVVEEPKPLTSRRTEGGRHGRSYLFMLDDMRKAGVEIAV